MLTSRGVCGWVAKAIIILMALLKDNHHTRSLSDLVKISFKDTNYLSNSGKNITTAPAECMEELLSAVHLVQVRNVDQGLENDPLQPNNDQVGAGTKERGEQVMERATAIKVGQLFHMRFYFTGESVYYDHHNNKLVLSRERRTAFKIIEHISRAGNASKEQTYDYIGNVVPHEHRYLIVFANELLFLKHTDHSVYLGTYDERCIVTFAPSVFRMDKPPADTPLLHSPCRLYSVQQERYVAFDIQNNEAVLREEAVCVQGMCSFEKVQLQISEAESPTLPFHRKRSRTIPEANQDNNQIAIRILQGNHRYFLTHHNNSTEKLTHDLARMLHPVEERLNTSNSFLIRFNPTIAINRPETTFNLTDISNISMAGPLSLVEEEEKEEIIEQITLKEINLKALGVREREEMCFLLEFYPSVNSQVQLFIYDAMTTRERVRGRQLVREKQLYLDYREVVASGKLQCVLKEYSSQKVRRESSKYKNILRVEYITREMLLPYAHYYSLLLNLKIYNYFRQQGSVRSSDDRGKMRLNLGEIKEVLEDFYVSLREMGEANKQKTACLLRELLEINLVRILEQLLEAIIVRKRLEEREEMQSNLREKEEDYPFETIEPIQAIAKIILLIATIMPERLIMALLRTERSQLFMRICNFTEVNRFFAGIESICLGIAEGRELLVRLEGVLQATEEQSLARFRNICILWGCRLMKQHHLQSASLESLSQQLVHHHKGVLTEDYLIMLELIKVAKGELFYAREVVRFLPLQRLQQEETSFPLRQAYFARIIANYKDTIRLPFLPKPGLPQQCLQRDNQRILRNYLQEVLPKSSKFQTIQNKLLAFQSCQLYLSLGENLLEDVLVEDQPCREYLPLLIALLEEHLQHYPYEEERCGEYVMRLLKCLETALLKHVRLVLYEESQLGLDDEETLLRNCLQQYHLITEKKATHAATRSSLEHPTTLKDRKITTKDTINKRSTKRKLNEEVSRTNQILSFFSRRRQTYSAEITECIDKQMIWDQLNQEGRLSSQQRLDFFQRILAISVLLLSPAVIFRDAYQGLIANPVSFPSRLVVLLDMMGRKAHKHQFWQLVERLGEEWEEDEWRTIVAVINHNRLLKAFILRQERQTPSERQLACLFRFLNELLLQYLEWTNSRIFTDRLYHVQSEQEHRQIDTDYHHFSNDLEPSHFLTLLGQVQPTYTSEEISLHLTIVRSMGVITALPHYTFYSQYIMRYECQNYHTSIVRLALAFLNALTPPLRTDFANNFQYSLFKQGEKLKELVCKLTGFREEQRNAPQRATNFNILSELRDERVSRLSFTSEDKEKEFLVGLFRLLGQVETSSTTHKEILPKLGYAVVAGVAGRFSDEILLRHEVLKFMVGSIEKQVSYGLNKQLKAGEEATEQPENDEQDTEEYALLLDFVKHTNYLLQRETEALKRLDLSSQQTQILFGYAHTLLAMVRIRDNILGYLKFEGADKIYRSDSGISQERSIPLKSMTSQESQSISNSSSLGPREDFLASARARQLIQHYNSMQIDESEVENMEGINKLLCYQLLQALDVISKREELPVELQKPLQWVENHYKISLTSQAALAAEAPPHKQLLYKVDKTYLTPAAHRSASRNIRNTFIDENITNSKDRRSKDRSKEREEQELSPTAPRYQAINSFLSLKVEGYLVLLIELLQRQLLLEEKGKGGVQINGLVVELMVLIQAELSEQIDIYRQEDGEFGRQDFEALPEEYYRRNGFQEEQEAGREAEQQRCCQLPVKKIEALFQLLLLVHRMDKPLYLLYLQTILERVAFYNVENQAALQRLIAAHFPHFYELLFAVVHRFSILSPVADDSFFTLPQGDGEGRGAAWAKGLRGMEGFHLASLNYYMLAKMLLACSRTLNFEFKSLFARPTIEQESVVSEMVDILQALLRNMRPATEQKLQWMRVTLKLVNNLMRGPVEPIIEVAINRGYSRLLVRLLTAMNETAVEGTLRLYLLGIKRLIAQGLFILIPFIKVAQAEVDSCQAELRDSYMRSKKAYNGEYVGIIGDYAEGRGKGEEALLYFELALNFYYCLIEMYNQRGQGRIAEVQVELLSRAARDKRRRKDWMVFYQIYEVFVAIFHPFYRRARGTYEELTDGRSQQELLRRAIVFFTRHVAQIEVRVYGKTKKISFLLLQEASCYNVSIRKELHRLIGKQERELRLHKLMKVSKYIIIRLEISKAVRHVLSHFKPLEIIVTNRQLWKSLCFIGALLLNFIFVFYDAFNNLDPTLFSDLRYVITAFTFLFILFLFLNYFLEVLPLKLKVYSLLRKRGFRISAVMMLVRDKTLIFALFYSIFLGISFFKEGFVSLLLLDYLFRFKVSSKMTFLMFRSLAKIVGIVILTYTLLYVVALLAIKTEQRTDACVDVASCTQDIFFIFMDLRFNVQLPYQSQTVLQGIGLLLRLFLKIITMSLLVGIVFTEKRKDDHRTEMDALQVRDVCFICGGQRNAVEKARNSNRGFEQHVEMEHNLWNYIYYLVYLKNKERKNLNAIEVMILEQWHNNRIDWLPQHFQQ